MATTSRLFIDKYRPRNLDDLDYNFELNKTLKNLSKSEDIPHLIFQGTKGCGKKTRCLLFLKEKLGSLVTSMRDQTVELKYQNKTIELQLLYSNYHYQINPSLHGVYDRLIIQDFIKDMVQYKSVGNIPYRIIVIEDADKLTYEAQQSLRRTLEKYIYVCRFIFLVSQEGNLIEALQSRCIRIRVPAPKDEEIFSILSYISDQENIEITKLALDSIVEYSQRDLSKAINALHSLSVRSSDILQLNKDIALSQFSEIEVYIANIIKLLFEGGDLETILTFRGYIYDLLVHCVEPLDVLKQVFHHLLKAIPDKYFKFKYEVIKATEYYENTLKIGSKPIYHLEGYIINLFRIVKNLQKQMNRDNKKVIKKVK